MHKGDFYEAKDAWLVLLMFIFVACGEAGRDGNVPTLNMQFERWYYYYHNHGTRHLLSELPLFAAEIFNMWMRDDNDDLLYMSFDAMVSRFPDRVFYNTKDGVYWNGAPAMVEFREN